MFDTSQFDTRLLGDEAAIESAIRAFESSLGDPSVDVGCIVDKLLSVKNLFEFVVSAASEWAASAIRERILRDLLKTPEDCTKSIAYKVLSRISLSLLFAPWPSSIEGLSSLRDCRRSVEIAYPALQVLARLAFSSPEAVSPTSPIDEDFEDLVDLDFIRVKRKALQGKGRRGTRAPSSSIDTKAFKDLGVSVPTSETEAAQLTMSLLEDQGDIVKYYFGILRRPELRAMFKTLYIPEERPQADSSGGARPEPQAVTATINSDSELPATFPILPVRAALYFDSVNGFGEWRILISTRAERNLRQLRRADGKMLKIVAKKLRELSRGHFSDDNHKRLTGPTTEIPVFEAKMTRDTRLVYQVDCVPEYESDVERQVLRIFGIYTHAQLDRRFWDYVGFQLGRKGKEYKQRCTFRNKPHHQGDNVFMPASFPPPAEPLVLEPATAMPSIPKEDLEELHSLLVLEKFVTFSQALLNSILADQDVTHVFDVSSQEKHIIEHTSSCYVIGRSGTGKTTTMLFKMLGIERSWEAYRDTMPKPRQLFVTQSRVLAEKVEEYFLKLHGSLAAANQSAEELAKLTHNKRLQQEQGLVDRDEEILWRGDLPKRFTELKDEHFPMFITFDHLCRLLEAEFREIGMSTSPSVDTVTTNTEDTEHISNDYMQQRRDNFISYSTFLESYWAHFPQSLTKGLDPMLVFSEFMGVIKGSENTLSTANGYLEKEAYSSLSHRTQGTFATQREVIYKLFQAYLKRKRERGEYDAADRTHAILNVLRSRGSPGQQVDFIYVDEAQDNLLIDALVVRYICKNPEGLFWAGDTAQTISVGSAFRFNDLKAFLYRVESTRIPDAYQTAPQTFQLTMNYRSHAGIVNCAHSVVELITQFWPHAIDNLAEEKGMVDGLLPVFFSGWDQHTVRYEQFLFGESGSHIEFGAQQCILVRDDSAREKLRAQVGDIGLILTLYESKGLEFNDVLLYNFFDDSTVDLSQWRVVLNALPADEFAKYPAPRFDDSRHSGVCRELKFLYVAITRARKNLWIADGSEKGEPMRVFWTSRGQIQNCTPGTDVPRLAMSSTPEEWAKTALSLFNNRRYLQSMHCYERAGLEREKAAAHAYHLRELARSTPVIGGDTTSQSKAFSEAAEAFIASAAEAVNEKRSYYRIAAECFLHSASDRKAAEAYFLASEYTLSAQHYRRAGMFDEAVEVIQKHRNAMVPQVVESIIDVSRLEYLRQHKLLQARALFGSDEEALEYMDDYGLDVARATVLTELGRYAEAAQLHLSEGRMLEAIRLLLLDGSEDSVQQASRCILDGLWMRLSFGLPGLTEAARKDDTLRELLKLSGSLHASSLDQVAHDEVIMFRAIAHGDERMLMELGHKFLLTHHDIPAAIMCFDRVFATTPKLQVASVSDINTTLFSFYPYVQNLQKLFLDNEPCDSEHLRRLFAFEPSTEELFLVHEDTVLHQRLNERHTPTAPNVDQGALVTRWELGNLLRQLLLEKLRKAVIDETEACQFARALQPCLPYALYGRCNRPDCPRDHTAASSQNAGIYNSRIRATLQQVLIYNTLYPFENSLEHTRGRRFWLRRFYEALSPPSPVMGTLHNLAVDTIPEFAKGMRIVTEWARELLYHLRPYPSDSGFLSSLLRMATISLVFDKQAATHHIPRIPCVSELRPPPQFMRGQEPARSYIVRDVLGFMHGTRPWSLTLGIFFMKHVADARVPIDIGVFCDLLDDICARLVIAWRLQKYSSLHDITLPLSWLMRLGEDPGMLRDQESRYLYMLIDPMAALLEQIYTSEYADHLLFENRDLSTLGYPIRNAFIARICKSLCLLGYNIPSIPLRDNIGRTVTSIRRSGRTYNALYYDYVTARAWSDLARTVRKSCMGSALDELIQLHDLAKTNSNQRALEHVRRVIYQTIEDIPALLRRQKVALRADAAPFAPALREQTTAVNTQSDEKPEEEQAIYAAEGKDLAREEEPIADDVAAGGEGQVAVVPTQTEVDAARTIQVAYRRHLSTRRGAATSTAEDLMRRIFTACQARSQQLQWLCRRYKMLFLGPLPHLLVCLEMMHGYIFTAKDQAKKRLRKVEHRELEEAQVTLNAMSRNLKDAVRLQKALGIDSDLHVRRDLQELKARTLEVEELMHRLPSGATLQWQKDWRLAHKGIVKEPPAHAVKTAKPDLNVSDLDFMDDL
ncbi:hypothetical protein CERSUDRAFT_89982 [Gelatoporia subvermispora B]|uniref:UvrD-like helicase ATP-binding domain-containing protein n=1 Tax=Ceriporiopsis subvermispora (strain B) TaxID=914234 RepID=M2RRC7_CERS8|nr:hypothetical protein CERSUDRAFT_89982 [Gelatoporia subvermispora B]